MRRHRVPTALICAVALCLATLAVVSDAPGQEGVSGDDLSVYTERVKTGFINWGAGFAEVVVEAPYETQRYGGSHAKIQAIKAADVMAEQALYRLLRGINLTGEMRLAGEPDLEEVLRRVAAKQSKLHNQRTANVTMTATYRLPIYGRKALSGLLREQLQTDDGPAGTLAGTAGGDYTSIVLDAAGTTLQAALFPRILDEQGTVLFGPPDLDAKSDGAAHYVVRGSEDKKLRISKAVARNLGANPLVLKVQKVGGEFFADVVLKPEQVEALTAAQPGDLLAQGRLFVIQTNSIDVSGS